MKIKTNYSNKKVQSYFKKVSREDWLILLDFNENNHGSMRNLNYKAYNRATLSQKSLSKNLKKIRNRINIKNSHLVTITAGINLSFKDYKLICYYLTSGRCRVKLQLNFIDKIRVEWLTTENLINNDH